MRKIWITALCTLCCYVAAGQSTMKFDSDTHDFGRINEVDGPVSHTFHFTNTGSAPFVIEEVTVSCGCTTPKYSREPIKPGQRGSIQITYDPEHRPGAFNREFHVLSDGRTNRNVIRIKGDVAGKPRTVFDDYPLGLARGIRLTDQLVSFHYTEQGKAKSMTLGYVNTSEEAVDVQTALEVPMPYLKVSSPGSVCAGCRGEITFTFDLTHAPIYGMISNRVFISVDGKRVHAPVSVNAIATENFDSADRAKSPRLNTDTQFHHFGQVNAGATLTHTFKFTNNGKSPLIIRNINHKDGVKVSIKEGSSIAPGKTVDVKVTLDTAEQEHGRFFRNVTLIVNDPDRPMRELRLVATIQ